MKKVIVAILLLCAKFSSGQNAANIVTIDFVKILNGHEPEALFFYQNNWKAMRDLAVKKGYIHAYRLIQTTPDSAANYNLLLMTEYTDSAQYELRETRFQELMRSGQQKGPQLLNDLKPAEFRKVVFSKNSSVVFEPEGN